MLERIVILSLVLAITYFIVKRFYSSKIVSKSFFPFEINNLNPALPTILYFWTEQCVQCNSIQKPAITKLKDEGSEFNFVSFNAIKELEITKHLNIRTVPSTVILNNDKDIRFINTGYVPGIKLREQLNKIYAN